jgi:hypothetical protein
MAISMGKILRLDLGIPIVLDKLICRPGLVLVLAMNSMPQGLDP